MNKVYDGTVAATVTLSDDRVTGDALTTNCTSDIYQQGRREQQGGVGQRDRRRWVGRRELQPREHHGFDGRGCHAETFVRHRDRCEQGLRRHGGGHGDPFG